MALTRVAAILPLSGGRRGLPGNLPLSGGRRGLSEGTCRLAVAGVAYLREVVLRQKHQRPPYWRVRRESTLVGREHALPLWGERRVFPR